jgi:hypothetical protein
MFSPLVPSPPRAARLFGGQRQMNFNTRSHPTMPFSTAKARMPDLYTSNGFCFCSGKLSNCYEARNTSTCSKMDNTRALFDQQRRRTKTYQSNNEPCVEQLDWPYERGALRDGSVMDARTPLSVMKHVNDTLRTCDVTDRLPPFWYRYRTNADITPLGTTSLDRGGSCHMGTAPTLNQTYSYSSGVCKKLNETRWNITVVCHGDVVMVLNKTISKAPSWVVGHLQKKRRSCKTCSPLPTWQDQKQGSLPKGPEVSYGIPFRWSASRLLAGDVKSWLCGKHHAETATCRALINDTAWGLESFINHFTDDATTLFNDPTDSPIPTLQNATREPDRYDDSRMWNGPDAGWVGCSQQPEGRCFGGISKEDWLSPRRGERCVSEFTRLVAEGQINESTVPLDICTLSADLNDMCVKIKNAQQLVISANCIAAQGSECQQSKWVYTPSMYATSNQEFVRSTVINFYEMYGLQDSSSVLVDSPLNGELVCPLDFEDLEIRYRNNNLTASCSSKQMGRIQEAIKIARRVVHIIVELFYIQFQILFTLFRLMIPDSNSRDVVVQELEFWFMRLIKMLQESITEISNLFYRVLTDTDGFGNALKTLVNVLCVVMNVALEVYNNTVCYVMKHLVAPFLLKFVEILRAIISFLGLDSGIISLLENILEMIKESDCATQFECTQTPVHIPISGLGTLPVSSRCWADYTPGIDDQSSYACAASDTCTNADLSYGTRLQDFGGIADSTRQVRSHNHPHLQCTSLTPTLVRG